MDIARSKAEPPDNDDAVAWVEHLGGDVECFQRKFGGRSLYIPHSVAASHPLAETLGVAVATELCANLPGVVVYVRTLQQKKVEARCLLVLLLTWAGFSSNLIAEIDEMTARHVSGIRDRLRGQGFLPPARRADNSHSERY